MTPNSKRYIKPKTPGLVVRQPHNGKPLPDVGAYVTWSGYWMRRMADGSVVKATPPAKSKKAAKSAKPSQAALPAADEKETNE